MVNARMIRIDTEYGAENVLERLFNVLSVTFSFLPPDRFVANIRGGAELCLTRTETGYELRYEVPEPGSPEALRVRQGFGDVEEDLPKLVELAFEEPGFSIRRD